MLDRRTFLKASGGLAGLLLAGHDGRANTALAQSAAGGRREVRVAGRRIRTVDIHAHCTIPAVAAMFGQKVGPEQLIGPERLVAMDRQGIDIEVLSINQFRYELDRDTARKAIQLQSEGLARACASQPDRFAGLVTVALQHPDLAVEQLDFGMRTLGLRGAAIGASVNGEDLASGRFDPFWAKCQELDAPIFIHPSGVRELEKRFQGAGGLANVIGNPLETTIALSKLIFEGTLDRFPRLKLCAAHGGGYLPSYADRSDYGYLTRPEQRGKALVKLPTDYLKDLYVDSMVFSSEALRHLIAVVGASRVMLGTDYPFAWTAPFDDSRRPRYDAVDHVLGTPGLTDPEKVGILGGNAATLLKLA
jgi:aminocarboxymuconate-semialdehyde decarboxylase